MSRHMKYVLTADLVDKLLSQDSGLQVSFLFWGCHHSDSYLFHHLLAMGHLLCLDSSSPLVSASLSLPWQDPMHSML